MGAGIQIPPNSSRILQRWGLLEKTEAVSIRPSDFILRSYKDGKVLSKQNLIPYAEERYGTPYLHIHRADYHSLLVDEARRVGVHIQLDATVTTIDFERPAARLSGKPDFVADIIIGADGLKSVCREALLGHADPPHLTGDLAYRITIKADDMKQHPLLCQLVQEPAITYWLGPDSHAVGYLLKGGGGLYNIVVTNPDNLPETVNMAKANLQEMRDFFKDWEPMFKALLDTVQDCSKWRLQNSREMKTWSHPSGRFALLGDACHATLPYLAQGAAQAVEDGAVLGALFEKIEDKSQLPDLLVIYETIRKARTTQVVKGSTAYGHIFHLHDGPRQQERDRQLLNHAPFEGYPNRWADPVFQPFLYGYDAHEQVEGAWATYKQGEFPMTAGRFAPRL